MIAFDTDVLTGILLGKSAFVRKASAIPASQQAIPVIVIEEILRGRLSVIRRVEGGKSKISIDHAYQLFQESFQDFQKIPILSYSYQADMIFQQWKQQGIRVPTHDLRIAAICMAHKATLITRNRRDFEPVPNLMVEFWA